MLTLADVVDGASKGIDQARQDKEYARIEKQRATLDAANKKAASVIEESKAQWALNGAQGAYTPNDETMFKAVQARGMAFAEAGDWESFFKNQAAVEGQRMRVRMSALQRYEQDGDAASLVKQLGMTVPDGKNITGVEVLKAGVTSPKVGAAPEPERVRITYDDGSTRVAPVNEVVQKLKASMVDPAKAAELNARLAYETALQGIKTAGAVKEAEAKGDQERKTEGVKAEARTKQITLEDALKAARDSANNAADLERTRVTAGATLGAAKLGKEGRVEAANISAGKDQPGGKRDQVFDQLHDELIRGFGKEQPGSLSGARVGDELTAQATRYAYDLMKKEGMSFVDALGKASAELKKRRAEVK